MSDSPSTSPMDVAVEHFEGGYNCAESALLALSGGQTRVQGELQRLATPFGGGVARRGMLCGALSGSLMAIGLHLGRSGPGDDEAKARAYAAGEAFLAAVEARFGSVLCRTLTGLDFHDPASHDAFPPVKQKVCIPLLRLAVEQAHALIDRAGGAA
ncbi:MAG TPA: C-GCAxxG-C-C family protein [Thermoanaerobaculaceae bacterium]|nr:C-GCAxxG-C-C family protein [Thermoanaerobaculaceae bacterium]HRS15259.1 C-GCAxxG-C-C family protein [Thermoanaerobaculaceae bacterium]